ncbi:MAG: DUF1957 domain-containing protein [candidate division NC10 bacterium]|nr:DUF1957 domain-containing protein [candidate division NC10 bacterium]
MAQTVGYFTFVLHAHLPYVLAHGRWPHGMDWLNEAAAETYLPLLNTLNRLVKDGYSPKLTLGLTPVLAEQLRDESFKEEFKAYLTNKIEAAGADEKEFSRTGSTHMASLARMWEGFYTRLLHDFQEEYHGDLVGAFADLQNGDHLEVMTSAATHAYLPLLFQDTSVQAQVKQGIRTYQRHFRRLPKGIWLPECAYRPRYQWGSPLAIHKDKPASLRKGVEEFLSENGLEYFIIDSHLLKGGKAIGVYLDRFEALQRLWGRFAEYYQPRPEEAEKSPYEVYWVSSIGEGKGPVAIFTRDPRTGRQVWSGEHGYPGNSEYLDFHKKRFPGGHRYWRVTHTKYDLALKEEYHPERADRVIPEQAYHFRELAKGLLRENWERTRRPGIVVAPYDAELFGHWWFEGTRWLYEVLKGMAEDPEVELTTCGLFLDRYPPTTVISIPEGSWGEGGFHWIWLNEWTEWTWRHIYEAELTMQELAREFASREDERLKAILKQAAREIMLLQASDWQFLISTWSARDYAEMRLANHYSDFKRLAEMAKKYGRGKWLDPGEWEFLGLCEKRDHLFPDIEPRWFTEVQFPAE